MSLGTKILNNKEILDAVNKRRNFAIISHPDAGKTTLTETVSYTHLTLPTSDLV